MNLLFVSFSSDGHVAEVGTNAYGLSNLHTKRSISGTIFIVIFFRKIVAKNRCILLYLFSKYLLFEIINLKVQK